MDSKCKEKSFELALHQNLMDHRSQGYTWTTTARISPSSRSLIPHGQLVIHLHCCPRHLATLLYFQIAHPLGPYLGLPSRLARSAPRSMFFRSLISRRSHSKILSDKACSRPLHKAYQDDMKKTSSAESVPSRVLASLSECLTVRII